MNIMNTPTRDPWEGEKALLTVEAACSALKFLRQRELEGAESQLRYVLHNATKLLARMVDERRPTGPNTWSVELVRDLVRTPEDAEIILQIMGGQQFGSTPPNTDEG